jgi:hypothetical protein
MVGIKEATEAGARRPAVKEIGATGAKLMI